MHAHDHHHAHGHHDHDRDHGLTEWSLFVLFSADPCVAVIPMIIAGAGWPAVLAVVFAYELATLATMAVLVTAAHAGTRAFHDPWLDRWGDVAAGALIVSVGAAMAVLGW